MLCSHPTLAGMLPSALQEDDTIACILTKPTAEQWLDKKTNLKSKRDQSPLLFACLQVVTVRTFSLLTNPLQLIRTAELKPTALTNYTQQSPPGAHPSHATTRDSVPNFQLPPCDVLMNQISTLHLQNQSTYTPRVSLITKTLTNP